MHNIFPRTQRRRPCWLIKPKWAELKTVWSSGLSHWFLAHVILLKSFTKMFYWEHCSIALKKRVPFFFLRKSVSKCIKNSLDIHDFNIELNNDRDFFFPLSSRPINHCALHFLPMKQFPSIQSFSIPASSETLDHDGLLEPIHWCVYF